jgi:hypothetical protein
MNKVTGIVVITLLLGTAACSDGNEKTVGVSVAQDQARVLPTVADRAKEDFSIKYTGAQLDDMAKAAMDTTQKPEAAEKK